MLTRAPFDKVTEATGLPLTREAASMIVTRYAHAAERSGRKRVLEAACGAGCGLGMLERTAQFVVGGDVSESLLRLAQAHYAARVPLVRFDVMNLPFRDESFDILLLLESTYYLPDFASAVPELRRVLSHGGELLLANANPERPDFVRSPYSIRYHSAAEFRRVLEAYGFRVWTGAAFPLRAESASRVRRIVSFLLPIARRILERLGLVPRTLVAHARLKRLVFGRGQSLPPEITADFAPRDRVVEVLEEPVGGYKVIYVNAVKT